MRSVAGIAIALWLGAMGFFAFVAAPAAFSALGREAAGRLVAVVFPRYYLIGVILGLLALGGVIGHWWLWGGRPGDWMALVLVLAMVALTLYAWLAVLPAAQAAREAMRQTSAGPAGAGFARLHRLSTMLNGAVMLAGLAFLVLQAARRP